MVFPIVIYGWDSWTIKKTECWRIDAFELRSWKRLLRVPWTAGRSTRSILRKLSPEYSLEGLVLKLKLQYFGHLIWRADSFETTLMLGKIEGGRRRGWQSMRWLDGITDSMDMSLGNSESWWWTGRPGVLQFMGSQRVRHDWATELNWTDADNITFMAESKEELKSLLMKVKEKIEKACLKVNLQKMKIMPFGSITSWHIDGETMDTVTIFIFLDFKIAADNDCSHEIKRCFLLGRKALPN